MLLLAMGFFLHHSRLLLNMFEKAPHTLLQASMLIMILVGLVEIVTELVEVLSEVLLTLIG